MRTTQELIMAQDALTVSDRRPVSSVSIWSDPVWRLDFWRPGSRVHGAIVYWPKDLPARLLHEFKCLLWTLAVESHGRFVNSLSTIVTFGPAFGLLGRWMARNDYVELAELDAAACGFLLDDLAKSCDVDDAPPAGEAAPAPDDAEEDGSVPFSRIYAALRLIQKAYEQRRVLAGLGLRSLEADPLGRASAYNLACRVRAAGEARTAALPAEVAMPLMNAADRLVAARDGISPGLDVAALQEAFFRSLSARPDLGPAARRARGEAVLRAFEFATVPGEHAPWHPRLPIVHDDEGRPVPPVSAGLALRRLVVRIRDACLLLLMQQTGMRPGELLSLRGGTDPATGLPACVSRRRSPNGALDVFRVAARVKKGRQAPDEAEWVVGAVPAGSPHLPATVQAVALLDRLSAPLRRMTADPEAATALAVSIIPPGMPEAEDSIQRLTGHRAATSISWSYASLIRFEDLPDRTASGHDLTAIKKAKGLGITAVHWRKTFAAAVVRIDPGALFSVTRHFKHLAMATTDGCYVGSDPTIVEALEDARLDLTARFLRERAHGVEAGGRGGRIAGRLSPRLRDALGEEAGARTEARAAGARLWPAEHGDCAMLVSPEAARCHDAAGRGSFLHDRPDFRFRSPELCSSCRNVVLLRRHDQFWIRRYVVNHRARRAAAARGEAEAAAEFGRRSEHALRTVRGARRSRAARRRPDIIGREEEWR